MTQSSSGPEQQRDVQRLLGRCLLRLQQYERLMKTLLAHHEVGGTAERLQTGLESQMGKYAGKSLGTLVKALFESYIVVDGADGRPLLDENKVPTDRISMAFRFQIHMSEERRREVMSAVEELVDMRNDLVHHLIERYDLWTDEGCAAASEHLHACYERIDRHVGELQGWTRHIADAALEMAAVAKSQGFGEAMVNGVTPDGSFNWSHAGIVQALRDASAQSQVTDGWMRLNDAKAWIAEHHPEQWPEKYGCRTWQQVVHESRCFRVEYRPGDDGQRVAWYRAL